MIVRLCYNHQIYNFYGQYTKVYSTLASNLFVYLCFSSVRDDLIRFDFWCLMSLSAISWQPVLVVEEAGVHGENHQPWASNW